MLRLLRIAGREYFSYLKTPGFWLSLIIAPAIGAVSGFGPMWAEKSAPVRNVAIIDFAHAGQAVTAALRANNSPTSIQVVAPPPEAATAATPAEASAAIRPYITGEKLLPNGGKLSAVAILQGRPDTMSVDLWTRDVGDLTLGSAVRQAGSQVMRNQRLAAMGIDQTKLAVADTARPAVREFSPKATSHGQVSFKDRLPTFAALGLAFTLWMMTVTGAGILLNSVIEEKSNRVLEVLLSSASVPEILGGKILGVAALAATVLAVWGGAGFVAVLKFAPPGIAGQMADALMSHGLIGVFLAYFVLGYLMYASIFVAIGAFCETPREAQTLVGPIMLMLSLPMIFLAQTIKRPDAPVLEWLAWFPPFTPFLMTARAASGLPWWEIAGTLALMAVTATVVVWISARAFRAGSLSTAKFDLPTFLKGIASAGR